MNLLRPESLVKHPWPVYLDPANPLVQGLKAYYYLGERAGLTAYNLIGKKNATLQAGVTRTIGRGGFGVKGTNATNSYIDTTLNVDADLNWFGSKTRTMFFRFQPAAASSAGNVGALMSGGDMTASANNGICVRQVNEAGHTGPDDWCIDLSGSKIFFQVNGTASNKVRTIVYSFQRTDANAVPATDAGDHKVFVDGVEVAAQYGSVFTFAGAMYLMRNKAAVVAQNYFNGILYEAGFHRGVAWQREEARMFSEMPFLMLNTVQPTRLIYTVPPTSPTQNISPVGIINANVMGSHTVISSQTIALPGIVNENILGDHTLINTGNVRNIICPGIVNTNVMGTHTIKNARPTWSVVNGPTNVWTSQG